MDSALNTERYKKLTKVNSLSPLTHWSRIHVAEGQCIYHMVLCFLHLFIVTFLSINLGYPSAFYIFLASWSRVSWSWNSVNIVCQHLVLLWNRIDNVASVTKVAFPYFGIKSLFPSKYIILLILVWLQIENEESFFLHFNLQFIRWHA